MADSDSLGVDAAAAALAGAAIGGALAVFYSAAAEYRLHAVLGMMLITIPAALVCALVIALPVYRALPSGVRESVLMSAAIPAGLFALIAAALMMFGSSYSELNFAGRTLIHDSEVVWANWPWLLASQYQWAAAGGAGGIIFYVARRGLISR